MSWLRTAACDENSGGLLLHEVTKIKGSHNDFLSGLNQKGSGSNGSKARGLSPCHRVSCWP